MSRRPSSSARVPRPCRPVLEALERRYAPACRGQFLPPVVTVTCTPQPDEALLYTVGPQIWLDDQPVPGATVDNTQLIHVNGDAGDDYITLFFLQGYRNRTLVEGGPGNDIILGSETGDVIHGGDGNDWIEGHAGIDTILGNAGDDISLGGEGNDWIEGNAGIDILVGDDGDDRLFTGNSGRAGPGGPDDASFEYAFGLCGDDTLDGDLGGLSADYLDGGCGNDLIRGHGLGDILLGSEDNDTLYGGSGDDYLDGGTGEDWLYGDEGSDFLSGAGGGPGHLSCGLDWDYFTADDGEDEWDATCEERL